jgi:hypothetical protein
MALKKPTSQLGSVIHFYTRHHIVCIFQLVQNKRTSDKFDIIADNHARSTFHVERNTYVTIGGGTTSVVGSLSPNEGVNNYPNLGGGGTLAGIRKISFSSLGLRSAQSSNTSSVNLEDYNEDLPPGVAPPNAIFARKYGLISSSQPLPEYIFQAATRPTADDVIYQECENLWENALKSTVEFSGPVELREAQK